MEEGVNAQKELVAACFYRKIGIGLIIINSILSLLLAYAAVKISGIVS